MQPPAVSFTQWAKRFASQGKSESVGSEVAYWLSEDRQKKQSIPLDFPGENSRQFAQTVSIDLDDGTATFLMEGLQAVANTLPQELLLAALADTLGRWMGQRKLLIDLETAVRSEHPELARTIGSFDSCYPLLIDLESVSAPGLILQAVCEQARAVPANGSGYAVLYYQSTDSQVRQKIRSGLRAEVAFRFRGLADRKAQGPAALFRPAPESARLSPRMAGHRPYLLVVTARARSGGLNVKWEYSRECHDRRTIEALARDFATTVRVLTDHCSTAGVRTYTPADFPEANLTRADLESLIARISEAHGE